MAIAQQAQEPSRRYPKKPGKNRFSHTQNTPYGMGDHYGSGVKAKLGKVRENTVGMIPLTKKKLKTPPKSLA